MRKSSFIVVAAALFLLAAVFVWLDIRLMRGQAAANSTVVASRANSQGDTSRPNPATTALYVSGEGGAAALAEAVLAEFKRQAQHQAPFGEVVDLNLPADRLETAQLRIDIDRQAYLWTPFYARSAFEVRVAYATDGDITFRNQDPPHFASGAQLPSVQMDGRYTITDVSWGLISLPGYRRYLAQQVVGQIKASVQAEVER